MSGRDFISESRRDMRDYTDDLRALSRALRAMHQALLEAELGDSAIERARTGTPVDRMQRLLHDPALAWLKPVSDLVVVLDGMLSRSDTVSEERAAQARRRTVTLFGPSPSHERHAVQSVMANLTYSHPKVTMALGDLRRALDRLPAGDQS